MDNPNRNDVGYTRAKSQVVVLGDARVFEAACDSGLNLLSDWARAAGLRVRYLDPRNAGKRDALRPDPSFDPVDELPTWIEGDFSPEEVARLQADAEMEKRCNDIRKAQEDRALCFSTYVDIPLDDGFSREALASDLQTAPAAALVSPALAARHFPVASLHPRERAAPHQPLDARRYDREIWSQLGFLRDLFLGLDAGNLVYNMTWSALVWICGPGSE